MKFKKIIVSALLLTFGMTPAFADDASSSQNTVQALQKLVQQGAILGGVVGVYHNNQVKFFSVGKASVNGAQPTPDTVYQIGSVTKVFTATLLAELAVQNQLNLKDPIDHYLPSFAHLQPGVQNQLTFENLATFTASLPDAMPVQPKSPEEFFKRFLNNWQPSYPIGSKYKYSNTSYELLAYLVPKIADTSYFDLMQKDILSPLNMTNTQTLTMSLENNNVARGYKATGAAVPYSHANWNGVAYLSSTPNDLMNFAKAEIGVGDVPPTLQQAMQLSVQNYFQINPRLIQNLAWATSKTKSGTVTWKNGSVLGYASFIGFNKQTQTAVVIVTSEQANKNNRLLNQITGLGIKAVGEV